jgi:hypothetical protein
VLAENVKHHVKEEEAELFAKARTGRLDLVDLGRRLTEAKSSFQSEQKEKKRARSNKKPTARGAAFKKQPARKPKKRTAA